MKQFLYKATAYVPVPKTVEGRVTASTYGAAASRAAKDALRHASFKRKRFDPTQGLTLRLLPAGVIACLLLFTPAAHAAAGAAPIEKIPEWGAMYDHKDYNRTFDQYKASELIVPPAYDLKQLTGTPMKSLAHTPRTSAEIKILTAKLFYSTRYCGSYDLDVGEYATVKNPHCALDLKAPIGTPIHAVVAGRVTEVTSNDKVFGISVRVTDAAGRVWLYAHMKKASVAKNRRVRAGMILGTVGSTGNTSGPHLHLQLSAKDGTNLNPASFLPY